MTVRFLNPGVLQYLLRCIINECHIESRNTAVYNLLSWCSINQSIKPEDINWPAFNIQHTTKLSTLGPPKAGNVNIIWTKKANQHTYISSLTLLWPQEQPSITTPKQGNAGGSTVHLSVQTSISPHSSMFTITLLSAPINSWNDLSFLFMYFLFSLHPTSSLWERELCLSLHHCAYTQSPDSSMHNKNLSNDQVNYPPR